MAIRTIARGNPLVASCAITDPATGLKASGLTVTGFIGADRKATTPIDPSLSVAATERTTDTSTTARPYDVTIPGDAITNILATYDLQSVWLIFTEAGNNFRCEQERQVIPGQLG